MYMRAPWFFLCLALLLSSCSNRRPLAAGLELSPTDRSDLCAIFPWSIGIDQIGWRKPLIIWHPGVFDAPWDVYDSSTGDHRQVTDAERLSDPRLREIAVMPAMAAWQKLDRRKQLW